LFDEFVEFSEIIRTIIFSKFLKVGDNFEFWDDFLGKATEHPTLIC
jgi:hypothetical protein